MQRLEIHLDGLVIDLVILGISILVVKGHTFLRAGAVVMAQ